MIDNKNIMQFDIIGDLTDPSRLKTFTGSITTITRTQLSAIGYSGSVIERITVDLQSGSSCNFILKHTHLSGDWLSQRSGDSTGREACMLLEPSLQSIWNTFECPYIAFAVEEKETGLLMNDYTANLFPDVREPISEKDETLILDRLAALHASFWNYSKPPQTTWLMRPEQYLDVLAPIRHPTDEFAPPPEKVRDSIIKGWEAAFQLLPADITQLMKLPAATLLEKWNALPSTLLHGDIKLANMAIVPPGKLVVFDWPFIGIGPCGIELGWYLAVNATRLAHTKEEVIELYRSLLQKHLHTSLTDPVWKQMTELAVITGARMLLWNKALGRQSGTQRGKDEWNWWVERLEAICASW